MLTVVMSIVMTCEQVNGEGPTRCDGELLISDGTWSIFELKIGSEGSERQLVMTVNKF